MMAKTTGESKKRSQNRRTISETLQSNPLRTVVGGLAAGLVAGALLPRSEREKQVMKPVGKRIAEGAKAAVAAAKESGKEQFSGTVMTKDSARKVLESVVTAARGAKS